jgi:hypothetical protein
MKKIAAMLIIAAALAMGCTANLKMNNLKINKSLKPGKPGKTAVISSINFFSGNSGSYSGDEDAAVKELRKSIENVVYNSGSFEAVASTGDQVEQITNKKNAVYLDFRVYAIENGSYNWWLAWPAVYPAPGWWPLQKKNGTVAVNIEVTASNGTEHVKTIKGYGADEYSIVFYGFFRTKPIDVSASKAFLNAVDDLGKGFADISILSGNVKDGVMVGTINSLNGTSEIVINHSNNPAPRMGELLYAMAGDNRIELIAVFPMMTSTKCRIVNTAKYRSLSKTMEVFR